MAKKAVSNNNTMFVKQTRALVVLEIDDESVIII